MPKRFRPPFAPRPKTRPAHPHPPAAHRPLAVHRKPVKRIMTTADVIREARAHYLELQRAAAKPAHLRGMGDADESLGKFKWPKFHLPKVNKAFTNSLKKAYKKYGKTILKGLAITAAIAGAVVFGPALLAGAGTLMKSAGGALARFFGKAKNVEKAAGDLTGDVLSQSRLEGGGDVPPDTAAAVIAQAQEQLGPDATLDQVKAKAAAELARLYPAGSPQQQEQFNRIPGQLVPAEQAYYERVEAGMDPTEAATEVAGAASGTAAVEQKTSEASVALPLIIAVGVAALVYALIGGGKKGRHAA